MGPLGEIRKAFGDYVTERESEFTTLDDLTKAIRVNELARAELFIANYYGEKMKGKVGKEAQAV